MNNSGYSPDPLPVFLLLMVGGTFASNYFCDALWNMPKQKAVLDRYRATGVETSATVVSQTIMTYSSDVAPSMKRNYVQYKYREEKSGDVLVKEYSRSTHGWARINTVSPQFTVVVLPGFPRSGVPKFCVENREADFGADSRCYALLLYGGALALFSTLFVALLMSQASVPSFIAFVVFCIVLGGPCARTKFGTWKHALLEEVIRTPN